jgi:hypothetical protein
MDETVEVVEEKAKCPKCGQTSPISAKKCSAIACRHDLKSELECLRSIDVSLITIRRIAKWWLVLSILGVLLGLLLLIAAGNGAKLF